MLLILLLLPLLLLLSSSEEISRKQVKHSDVVISPTKHVAILAQADRVSLPPKLGFPFCFLLSIQTNQRLRPRLGFPSFLYPACTHAGRYGAGPHAGAAQPVLDAGAQTFHLHPMHPMAGATPPNGQKGSDTPSVIGPDCSQPSSPLLHADIHNALSMSGPLLSHLLVRRFALHPGRPGASPFEVCSHSELNDCCFGASDLTSDSNSRIATTGKRTAISQKKPQLFPKLRR
ncbi:unnamed protein product [Polarella glacialis]|uniref:Secreted protein n=1 Tax=Polarella glacialis TaxID=89957 RepID=A0A813JER1_POLGL|nr:unnamed protein product [Polarella glacialis]